jgi:hypothetical protein
MRFESVEQVHAVGAPRVAQTFDDIGRAAQLEQCVRARARIAATVRQ